MTICCQVTSESLQVTSIKFLVLLVRHAKITFINVTQIVNVQVDCNMHNNWQPKELVILFLLSCWMHLQILSILFSKLYCLPIVKNVLCVSSKQPSAPIRETEWVCMSTSRLNSQKKSHFIVCEIVYWFPSTCYQYSA